MSQTRCSENDSLTANLYKDYVKANLECIKKKLDDSYALSSQNYYVYSNTYPNSIELFYMNVFE